MNFCRIHATVKNEITMKSKVYFYIGANGGNDRHEDLQCDDFDPWAVYEWSADIKDVKVIEFGKAHELLEVMRKKYPNTTLWCDLVPEDSEGNPIKDSVNIFGYEESEPSEEELLWEEENRRKKFCIFRTEAGLSQKQLAEKSGVSYSLVCKYESGEKDINKAHLSTLLKLTTAMKCSIKDILTDEDLIKLIDHSYCMY